mgnify:FL=1
MSAPPPTPPPAGSAPRCPLCDSLDLAHYAAAWGDIPPETVGFIGCRHCHAWWQVMSVGTPETIFTPDGWRVVAHGVGTYGSARERSQVTIYSTENM